MQVSIPRPIPHPLPREPSSSAPYSSTSAVHPSLRPFPFMFPPRDKNCSSQANRLLPTPALLSQSLAYRQFLALGAAQNWKLDENGYIPLPPTVSPYWRPPTNLPFYFGENFPPTQNQFTYGHLNAPSKKLYACPECRYITDRKNNLKRHVGTMHKDCDRVLECCGIFFKTKASLRDHVLIFHSNGYMCGHCGRNFCRKALLKRHMTVHSGQKDFVCPQCGYSTSHKSNLERHKKVHERELVDGTEMSERLSGSPNSHRCDDADHNISECLSDDSDESDDICDEIDVVTS